MCGNCACNELHLVQRRRSGKWIFPVFSCMNCGDSVIFRASIPSEEPTSGIYRSDHFAFALQNAVRVGNDTDTFACIAGACVPPVEGVDLAGFAYPKSSRVFRLAAQASQTAST